MRYRECSMRLLTNTGKMYMIGIYDTLYLLGTTCDYITAVCEFAGLWPRAYWIRHEGLTGAVGSTNYICVSLACLPGRWPERPLHVLKTYSSGAVAGTVATVTCTVAITNIMRHQWRSQRLQVAWPFTRSPQFWARAISSIVWCIIFHRPRILPKSCSQQIRLREMQLMHYYCLENVIRQAFATKAC